VLLREAQDVAIQAGDVKVAIDAVELSAEVFDIDALAARGSVLAALGKSATAPEEYAALVQSLLKLADDQMIADQYDAADKSATAAIQYARKSKELALSIRAANRAKEVAEAKLLFSGMKDELQTLAKTPEDPRANLEMGQFLCYVKGDWDLGVRFLVKGSDVSLKALAEKDVAASGSPADQVSLADGWWDFAEREKSPLRKGHILAHSRALYEAALPQATGLLSMKIEKRLKEFGPITFAPQDLLHLLHPQEDGVKGDWALSKDGLTCPATMFARLQVPYEAPEEYDFTLVVERIGGDVALIVGLAMAGDARCQVIVDWDGISGVDSIDGKHAKSNETTRPGAILKPGRPVSLLFSVRRDGLSLSVDGKVLFSWKGALSRLSYNEEYAIPNRKALMVAWHSGGFRVKKMELLPLSGLGRKLR
jgi:hypothetical protein